MGRPAVILLPLVLDLASRAGGLVATPRWPPARDALGGLRRPLRSDRPRHRRTSALRSDPGDDEAERAGEAVDSVATLEGSSPDETMSMPSVSVVGVAERNEPRTAPRTESLTRMMSLMGTSPRRIFLSASASATIALASNLFGVTSKILEGLPEDFVETTGLDAFYPRGEYKRVAVRGGGGYGAEMSPGAAGGGGGKCSFLIPKEWVADTGLALAQARRRARALDYSMGSDKQAGVLPDAAYGPPGRLDSRGLSNGDTNVSVIVNNGVKDFSLAKSLGTPEEAAATLLSSRFGPRSPTTLASAAEERRRSGNYYLPVYKFDYTVDRGERGVLRAISVVAGNASGDAYATLTVVSPEAEWTKPDVEKRLCRIADSFKMK